MPGNAAVASFVSCRHSTSGCAYDTHSSTRASRAFNEFTFHVATRIAVHPSLTCGHMEAVVWSDYLCPWCYAGLDRSARLEAELGVTVTPLPYELHPGIPLEGVPSKSRYSRIALECEAAG